jgi:glutathione S-transferase
MITVHHLENSRSQRIPWLLEELGLEYKVEHYKRVASTGLAPASLKAVHPLGKSPVITDGERVVAESGAIIEYLLERYGDGRLAPRTGTPEHLQYSYWMHYAEGTLMPLMVMSLIFARIERAPWPVRPIAKGISRKVHDSYLGPNIKLNTQWIENTLGKQPWFAGNDFSAADIQMSFPLEALSVRADRELAMPRIREFLERIHACAAYQRALDKVGPLQLLGRRA